MSKLKAITIADNEEFLRQVSKPVEAGDKELEKDIAVLEEFCKDSSVMAMAAVQLGIPKRLVYIKNTNLEIIRKIQKNIQNEEEENYNEARVLVNPEIISREGITQYWEACASCLNNMGRVLRPYKIKVKYQDTDGNPHIDVFEGFESTVLSHEMDHLDGILHMDVAEEVLVLPKEERKKFRQTNEYKIFSKTGTYEELRNKYSNKKNP